MKTENISCKLLNWRIKLITLLSVFMLTISLCFIPLMAKPVSALEKETAADWMGGISNRKQWTDYSGWQANTLNGLQFDNMTLGMFGSNFFLGYDENGNFAVERSSGSGAAPGDYGAFSVTSREPVCADGFSTTFSFEPTPIERGEPEVGGTFAIGLGDSSDNPFAFMYIVFRYNGESLDMYLIQYSMAHGYNVMPDGTHSCYNKGSLVELSTLATRKMAKPKLNEKITLQLKKITKAEADVYNADPKTTNPITMDGLDKLGNEAPTTGKSAWRWIVNGVVIDTPAFSEAQEKGPMFDAYSLPKDKNGDYYGYLWVDSNYRSGADTGMLSSSNIDTISTGHHVQKNLSGRITFYDIVSDGTASGAATSSSAAAMPGTTAGAITDAYTYATATVGQYKDKTTVSSSGAFSFQYTDKVKLNAFDMTLALKKIDQPNGGSFRVLFKKSENVGTWSNGKYANDDEYVGLVLRKTSWRGLAVLLDINGREYLTDFTEENPYVYDFKDGGEISIQLFSSEVGAFMFFNGANVGLSSEIQNVIKTFTTDQNENPEGYLYLQNDSGSARVTMAKIITDGTAQQKPWVTSVDTPADTALEYGDSYSNPEKVTVTFDNGTTAEWNVTWSVVPDTFSAQTYTVTGAFTDMTTLQEEYFISSTIINALTFNVTVGLDPALIASSNLGTGYDINTNTATFGPEGYRWYSVYSVQIPYYYKQDEGYDESVDNGKYEHLMTDPSLDNLQFHTSDLVRKDVDGYELEFSIKNHTPAINPDIYILLTATPGHPEQIGQGNIGLHLVPSQNQTKMYATLVTWMGGAMGGLPEGATIDALAYFQKEDEAPVREIDFDYTGNTMYKLRWSLSGEEGSRRVDMTFETPDSVYKVVDVDGNHIAKADYQFNANHEATALEPNSKFINDKGYLFVWVERGYNEITFRQRYNEYVASYQKPNNVTATNGTALADLGLPTTIAMKTNKNVDVNGTVEYSNYDPTILGPQDVTGTITLPGDYEFEDNVSQTFTVKVTVKGVITSIPTMPSDIEIKVGETYTLPEKYTVMCGESEQVIDLVWVGDCDVLTAGEYVLTATVLGYYSYADDVSPITIKVVVTANENTNPDPDLNPNQPEKESGCGGVFGATSVVGTAFALASVCVVCLKKRKEN